MTTDEKIKEETLQKCQYYYLEKMININILQVNYFPLIKDKLEKPLRKSF